MDIFTKYSQGTWIKNVGYPCVVITEDVDVIYSGRNPQEYFEQFDINYYQECKVYICYSISSYVFLGTISQLNGYLPIIKLEILMGRVK